MTFPSCKAMLGLSLVFWLALPNSIHAQTYPDTRPLPDLLNITVDNIMAGFKAQDFTSVDLVRAYIARTAEVQEALRPVIEINPQALEIAQALDDERLIHNTTRGPLHGVPILLKDNIGTLDQLNTTAGSYALLGSIVPRDSTVARNLRAAGAVILGKVGMSEWAYERGICPDGWSARGGQVKGAYVEDQSPSGSSSGSGVAASLGLAALTVGSDTGGSIIAPAGVNAVVGIRPSTGLVSRDVIVPITAVTDTAGPMTHSVKDAAYLLSAMAGPRGDPGDNYTDAIPFDKVPDYASYCTLDGLDGARIGIPRNWLPGIGHRTNAVNQQLDALDAMLPMMSSLGAEIIDNANFSDVRAFRQEQEFGLVLDNGFKHDIASYFSNLDFNPTGLRTLEDLLNWTVRFPAEQYPPKGVQLWRGALESNVTTSSPEFLQAVAHNTYLGTNATVQGALDDYDLDALIVPSDFAWRLGIYAGYPVISVPLGFYDSSTKVTQNQWGLVTVAPGLPFGLSFVGHRFGEAKLIQLAYAYEQATKVRYQRLPLEKYTPRTQLGYVTEGAGMGLEVEVQCPDALGLPIS